MIEFFTKVKQYVIGIMGVVIAVLFGWLYITEKEKGAADAELKNQKDQTAINNLSQDQAKNDGENAAEAQKRADLKKQVQGEQNETDSTDELTKFFNDNNSNRPS